MDCSNSNPLFFSFQTWMNSECQDCAQNNGCVPIVNLCYTGAPLTCSGVNTGDNLEVALQKIDTQICSAIGDYSTYQFHCLPAFYGQAINTEAQFVDAITAYACDLTAELVAFTGTTFPAYQTTVTNQFNTITVPGITCAIAGVTNTDNLNTVLGKYCTAFSTLHTNTDISGVDWSSCFTVTTTPVTQADGFTVVLEQICQVKTIASNAAVLPVFNNTSTCLPSPGVSDTLVSTIGKIITKLCQSATWDSTGITWGCITSPGSTSDLIGAVTNIVAKVNTLSLIKPTYSADFVVTQTDSMNPCAGITVALATPINQDRLVASTPSDGSPGTLVQKLTPGSNIQLDSTTTPGQIIINATNTNTYTGITSTSLKVTVPGSPSNPLDIEYIPSSDIGNIAAIGTDGRPFVPSTNANVVSLTRSALLTLIASSSLIQGTKYLITDYQTVYTQPESLVLNSGAVEPLLVEAISANTLSPIAYSALYPEDIIYYEINNDNTRVPGCTLGYIYRRFATDSNIDIPFDWRVVLFRRYKLNVTAVWSNVTTYAKNTVVVNGTDIYFSRFSGNLNNALSNTTFWRKFEWANGSMSSPTQTNWIIGSNVDTPMSIPIDNTSFIDLLMFSQGVTSGTFNNSITETIDQDLLSSNNTVFIGSNISENKIGTKFTGNTIADNFQNNNIGDSFSLNSIASSFTFNNISKLFQNSVIGTFFKNNIIHNAVDSLFINSFAEANLFDSYISYFWAGNGFVNNKVGLAAHRNIFGVNAQLNTLGDYSTDNSFGDSSVLNIIGTNAVYNVFGDTCQSNTVGNYSANNTIGTGFVNNVISHYFTTNIFGNACSANTLGLSFQNSTVGNNFQNNIFVDFCNHLTIGDGYFSNQIEYPITSTNLTGGVASTFNIGKDTYINQILNTFNTDYKTLVVDNATKKVGYVSEPFKYDAQITQSGTSDPTVTQYRNSFPSGSGFTWVRTSAGLYTCTYTGSSSVTGANIYVTPLYSNLNYVTVQVTSSTTFTIFTADLATNTGTDGLLTNIGIKLEKY